MLLHHMSACLLETTVLSHFCYSVVTDLILACFNITDLKGNPLPANVISVLSENNGTQKLLGMLYDQVNSKLRF